MKKSIWIEAVEWCVLGAVMLFLVGVVTMRNEIMASPDSTSTAPVETFEE
jgi:hypothetical protein